MSKRKIESVSNTDKTREAKVYRDSEWQEYIVEFYKDGQKQEGASYHTDEKSDAQSTARAFAWRNQG